MDDDLALDLITFHSQVAAIISNDHMVSGGLPLLRSLIEMLVEIPIVAERIFAYLTAKFEVTKSIYVRREFNQLRVCSNNLRTHPHHPAHCSFALP